MAVGILDVFSLLFTSAFVIGVVMSIIIIPRKYREVVDAAKASLRQRGWTVSSSSREDAGSGGVCGQVVALKSNKKRMMDREQYLDATQRGVIMALNASHFGAPDAGDSHLRSSSSSSHGDPAAGSHLAALQSLLRYHHDHAHDQPGEAPVRGAVAGGISDEGSDTASIDVSVGASASPEERHYHLRRWKHLVGRHED